MVNYDYMVIHFRAKDSPTWYMLQENKLKFKKKVAEGKIEMLLFEGFRIIN